MHGDFALCGSLEKSMFGVCSIFCMFWACSMRRKFYPEWCSGKLDFSRIAAKAANCRFKMLLMFVAFLNV